MNIDINFIPKSRQYLKKFVDSNYGDFFYDMGELQPRNGYGEFPYSSDIVQCMRNITHTISDVFSDLSIPEKFQTSDDLINKAESFIELLDASESYFSDSINIVTSENKHVPSPIYRINNNREKTIRAFKQFVKLAKVEQNEKEFFLNKVSVNTDLEKIENLLRKFHIVQKQLNHRRNDNKKPRQTIIINDEYDVQDLLHSLLKIFFDDVRPEEWNPSYAGSSKRSDFLLKNENIVIEVKKTRANLKDKELGEQLIIDKANYKGHKNCDTLICFIYDPDNYIKNPSAIVNDLKEVSDTFSTLIYIYP